MKSNRFARLAVALLAPLVVVGALAAQAGAASAAVQHRDHHRDRVLFVSPEGNPGNSDRSCQSAAYATIQSAVNAARSGRTVVVCAGTYHEQVVVSKPLTLVGKQAIIDQTGVTPTFQVTLPGPLGTQTIFAAVILVSSRITFTGFTIQNAQGEGVLAAGIYGSTLRDIVISRDAVVNNALAGGKSQYFECAAMGQVPGDCGEGVHFAGRVADSTIRDNLITGNSGGVLLSDDIGPTYDNVVEDNIVTGNLSDCGITVPGHNPMALNANGVPQPKVAGVYDNVIRGNVVTGNGTTGFGAGVLFANAGPGTASYDNLVEGNFIEGNGLSGVTMHAHTLAPGQFEDLNGNVIVGNAIGKNNILGDTLDGPPTEDLQTTGVLVFSGGIPVKVKIARNLIFNNEIGIWLSAPVTARGLKTNTFINVTTTISANH